MSDSNSHKHSWDKLISGDINALQELYGQHYLGLMNYGRKMINDRAFVNGCFMDMLIGFWNKRSTLPQVENVRSYLLTSFRRVILHEIQSGRHRELKHHESGKFDEHQEISYEEYLIRIQTDTQIRSKIAAAIGKLTERQSELVRLKFFEDLDYDEIAERCGITKRTAYNIIHDAIKILKKELYDDQNSSFLKKLPMILWFY